MVTRPTKSLLLAAVILLLLILAFDQQPPRTTPARVVPLPRIDPGHIRAFELEVDGASLRLEREEGGWLVAKPFRYPALEGHANTLLEDLSTLHAVNFIPITGAAELAQFGLDVPKTTLRLEGYESNQVLRFGSLTPIPNNGYLSVDGHPGVYVVPSEVWYRLPRDTSQWEQWRDRRLAHAGAAPEKIDAITAHADTQPLFVLQKNPTNQVWRLMQPAPAKRADAERVRLFLERAQGWQVAQFLPGTNATPLPPLGLDPAALRLRLMQGTNQRVALDFGAPHTNAPSLIYARDAVFNTLLAVAQTNTMDLLKTNPWHLFGDRRLSAPIETNQIARIEIRSGAEQTVLIPAEGNGTWQMTGPLTAEADAELVRDLLLQLQALEAASLEKDIVTDFVPYQLANPPLSYTVWRQRPPGAVTNTIMAGVDFGQSQAASGMTFARRHDEDMVYLTPTALSERLPSRFFQLRDRRLWQFTSSDVAKVTLHLGGKPLELARNVRNIWSGAAGQLDAGRDTEVNAALAALGRLRAVRWVARGNDKFGDPAYEFEKTAERMTMLLRRGVASETQVLTLGRVTVEGERYAAAQVPPDNEHVIFIFPEETYRLALRLFRAAQPTP